MITVDKLDTPEIKAFITKLVIDIIKDALADKSADNQLSMLLYAHIKDMESFKHVVLQRLSTLESQMLELKDRLEKVEKTMLTKEDLKQFATKEDLKQFATKEDLKQFATKEDLKVFAKDIVTKIANHLKKTQPKK